MPTRGSKPPTAKMFCDPDLEDTGEVTTIDGIFFEGVSKPSSYIIVVVFWVMSPRFGVCASSVSGTIYSPCAGSESTIDEDSSRFTFSYNSSQFNDTQERHTPNHPSYYHVKNVAHFVWM